MSRTLIDVRAPIEVARGSLPGAHNLPLMTDEERHQVGLQYKLHGQKAAVALGYTLAGPFLPARVAAWRQLAEQAPTAITCWRGGMRSALALEHLNDPHAAQVAGGYKAIRRYLMEAMAHRAPTMAWLVVAGLTGSGKTDFLHAVEQENVSRWLTLDLEGLATHRGSAFGAMTTPQPAQASFENALAAQLVLTPHPGVLLEDESRFVGRRSLPDAVWHAMQRAPVIWLDASLAARVENVTRAYVVEPAQRHGVDATHARLRANLLRVRPRWGGAACDAALAQLDDARHNFMDPHVHAPWVAALLRDYYDPLYLHAFTRANRIVCARGQAALLHAYVREAQARD